MSFEVEELYKLLPAIYRIRDAEQGEPLKAILSVIADQTAILEEDLEQLYDNQFVETCAPWVLPYIGDIIGIHGLQGIAPKTRSPRAEVANTIGYRRRKGTAAMLEQLAHDVTGWPARAVEFFKLLATTQYMNHIRPDNLSFIDLRKAGKLEYLNSPFESAAHTVDVRRIAHGRGRYNIPNIGIFLWPIQACSLKRSTAVSDGGLNQHFYFNPLGQDIQLYMAPQTEDEVTHLAEPVNVPMKISYSTSKDDYYGQGMSVFIELADINGNAISRYVSKDDVVVCNLTDWGTKVPKDKVAVDPVRGRISFGQNIFDTKKQKVLVTFHYGFSAGIGGGEYKRFKTFESFDNIKVIASEAISNIQEIIDSTPPKKGKAIEVRDNGSYQNLNKENMKITLGNQRIELRAADGYRPALVLNNSFPMLEIYNSSNGDMSELILNGVLLNGQISVNDNIKRLCLRHCTLVSPGATYPVPYNPSLIVNSSGVYIEIDSCILVGGIQVAEESRVKITNSILDAGENGSAYTSPNATAMYGGPLHIENSTVIGTVKTAELEMASNTIFLAPVTTMNRQKGCVRFSHIPDASLVPRRYHCYPENKPENKKEAARLRPIFLSLRYGDAAYCRLSTQCHEDILRGADDGGEIGVFHDLYQPQREAHLRVRLEEYLRFGLEAGVFYVT